MYIYTHIIIEYWREVYTPPGIYYNITDKCRNYAREWLTTNPFSEFFNFDFIYCETTKWFIFYFFTGKTERKANGRPRGTIIRRECAHATNGIITVPNDNDRKITTKLNPHRRTGRRIVIFLFVGCFRCTTIFETATVPVFELLLSAISSDENTQT